MVLPKSMRLKGYKCFDYLYKEGVRYNGCAMLLRVVRSKPRLTKFKSSTSQESHLKCAISISNKYSKSAVKRNKIRRIFHDHLRKKLAESNFKNNHWALLSLKPNKSNKTSLELIQEFDKLLLKAGLIS